MSLSLDFDKKRLWHPGDALSGVLQLEVRHQLDVRRVEIVLEGQAKIGRQENDSLSQHDGSVVTLFRKQLILLRGPYTIASNQQWPFSLRIPETCDSGDKHRFRVQGDGSSDFNNELSQALPSTLHAGEANFGDSYNVDISAKYWIQAKVLVDGAFHNSLEMWLPLKLMPYRDESLRNPIPKHVEVARPRVVQSLHLDPNVGDRNLRLKERLKATFASSSIPSVSYDIVVDFPDQGILNKPPHILLSVRRNTPDSGDLLPQVELKSFTAYVIRKTGYAIHPIVNLPKNKDIIRICTSEVEVAHWSGSKLIEGKIDLRELYQHGRLDWKDVVPDFETFNIYEHHTLKLKMEIEAARQASKVIIPGPSFKVLSPYLRPLGETILPADTTEGDPELPQYEEQMKH